VAQAFDQFPIERVLGVKTARELTTKQKTFARLVAEGNTGAEAYRQAYSRKCKPSTAGNHASRFRKDARIMTEIEAYQAALEAAEHRTPAALRQLVIKTLVDVMIDPSTPPAAKINAAKVAGQITEVAAFTERKEVRTITSSEDAKAKIMQELRRLTNEQAVDATIIEADSLLAELAGIDTDATPPAPDTPQTQE